MRRFSSCAIPTESKVIMDNPSASRPVFTRVSQFAWLSTFWFAIHFIWATLLPVVIPARIEELVPLAELGTRQGILLGLGAAVSAVLQLTIGFVSDSTESRFGQRKPYIAVGVVVSIGAILYLVGAVSYWNLVFAYFLVQIFMNVASVPYQSLMPDLVPEKFHGRAAAMMGIFDLSGKLLGLIISAMVVGGIVFSKTIAGKPDYTMLAVLYCLLLVSLGAVVLVKAPNYPAANAVRWMRIRFSEKQVNIVSFFRELMRFEFRESPDFLKLSLSRTFILFGYYTYIFFIYRFAKTNLNVGEHRELAAVLLAAIIVGAVVGNIAGGYLCDRIGKRRVIYIGMAFSIALMIPLIFSNNILEAIYFGAVLGIGWGAFIAADWAFAFTLIPKERTARYMGLWDLTALAPQMVAPLIAGIARDRLITMLPGGPAAAEAEAFRIVFSFAIIYFIAGLIVLGYVREPAKKDATE